MTLRLFLIPTRRSRVTLLVVCSVIMIMVTGAISIKVYKIVVHARDRAYRSMIRNGMRMTVLNAFASSSLAPSGNLSPEKMLSGVDVYSEPAKVSWRLHRLTSTSAFGKGWGKTLCPTCTWDSKENLRFLRIGQSAWFVRRPDSESVGIMAITGTGSAFDGAIDSWRKVPKNCIVAIEVFRNDIKWTEPVDLDVSIGEWKRQTGIESACNARRIRSFAVCFADCVVFDIRCEVPEEMLLSLMVVESARTLDRENVLQGYRLLE